MILVSQDGSFKYHSSFPLLDKNGAAVSSEKYSTSTEEFEECNWIDKTTFQLDEESETVFEVNDEILLKIDGFSEKNIITYVNEDDKKYKVAKVISQNTSALKVKKNFFLYTLISLAEGYYFFKNNETIAVFNRFASIFIDFNTLVTRNKNILGLFRENDVIGFNKEALNSVFGDLSYLGDPFRLIDIGVFRELMVRKILSLVEMSYFRNDANATFTADYNLFLKNAVNNVKLDKDTSTVEVEEQLYDSWDLHLGG